ncbi:MAG: M1 family metallopeptidase [Bacteroidales bacterium]|nr:M1 family metallopeptidase [Bacteroidales bacterium]
MKKYQLSFLIIFLFLVFHIDAQILALKESYWQQKVNYKMDVELDPEDNMLFGNIEIAYYNQSPDTLHFIVLHLWPNGYSSDYTALSRQLLNSGEDEFYWSTNEDRGFIDSLNFVCGDKNLKLIPDNYDSDIAYLWLDKPLNPNDSVIIVSTFRVKIPNASFSRLGFQKVDRTNSIFSISQWYPKPAVYESEGWNYFPYLNQGEFYSEFGNYEVSIKVPEDYVVAASGTLDEKKKVKLVYSDAEGLEYRYSLKQAHDFAWFAAKDYTYRSREIYLPSGAKVLLQAYYLPENQEIWSDALDYMERGIRFYSELVGEYPYPVCSAVDGALTAGGGMEYPTITIIAESDNKISFDIILIHEIGHNWFYGIFGFNERAFPWLDEGLNTFYQSRYEDRYYPDYHLFEYLAIRKFSNKTTKPALSIKSQYYYSWLFAARKNLDQPLYYHSEDFSKINYFISAYEKPTLFFRYLKDYLGENQWDSLMQGFYEEWKFKHPHPDEFVAYLKEHSNKDLDWFFYDWLSTTDNADIAISRVRKEGDSLIVSTEQKGEIPVPFKITTINKAGKPLESKWVEDVSRRAEISFQKDSVHKITVDFENEMPDFNRNNQTARAKGILRTATPLRFNFFYKKPFDGKNRIFWIPAIAWNAHNRFMAGLAIYSEPVFDRRIEFQLVPLYSFKNQTFNGEYNFNLNLFPKNFIRKIRIGVSGRKYDMQKIETELINPNHNDLLYFHKTQPYIQFFMRTPNYQSAIKHHLSGRGVFIWKEQLKYSINGVSSPKPDVEVFAYNVVEVSHFYQNNRKINPFEIHSTLHLNDEIVKAFVSYKQKIHYNKKRYFALRLFAGNFFTKSLSQTDYSFKVSSWSGSDDYLFDNTFPYRNAPYNSGVWAAHAVLADGGFSIPTIVGRSQKWIAAVNLSTSLPFTNMVKPYFNFAAFPEPLDMKKTETLYEAGLKIVFLDDRFEMAFPIFYSKRIKEVAELNNRDEFRYTLRFIMDLNFANPIKWLREMEL